MYCARYSILNLLRLLDFPLIHIIIKHSFSNNFPDIIIIYCYCIHIYVIVCIYCEYTLAYECANDYLVISILLNEDFLDGSILGKHEAEMYFDEICFTFLLHYLMCVKFTSCSELYAYM